VAGDQVAIDGEKKVWTYQGDPSIAKEQTVICFHKPTGYVVSKNDKHNATIYEILPNEYRDYYYIGRLDKESEGLLLLTDTSELVNKLQHPSFDRKKIYVVTVHKPWEDGDSKRILK
jgi:23S rRNA pseudouridine2605 synthase